MLTDNQHNSEIMVLSVTHTSIHATLTACVLYMYNYVHVCMYTFMYVRTYEMYMYLRRENLKLHQSHIISNIKELVKPCSVLEVKYILMVLHICMLRLSLPIHQLPNTVQWIQCYSNTCVHSICVTTPPVQYMSLLLIAPTCVCIYIYTFTCTRTHTCTCMCVIAL